MTCQGGCSTIGELVDRVAGLLNDADAACPNTRWPRPTLVSYLNEALCRIQAQRPDAFAITTEIVLKPGALQYLPPAYVSLSSIEASIKADGTETPVQQVDDRFSKIFSKKPCLSRDMRCENPGVAASDPCAAYSVKSFVKNPLDEKTFRVEPPVPAGCAPRVTITAIRRPTKYCVADVEKCLDIDCEYEAAIIEWVLYRAMSMDTESTVASKVALEHRNAFELLMRTDYAQEQRYGSGYYRGQEGTGDPNFRSR